MLSAQILTMKIFRDFAFWLEFHNFDAPAEYEDNYRKSKISGSSIIINSRISTARASVL